MSDLLSPKDIQSTEELNQFEKRLRILSSHVKQARKVKTPKDQIKVQEGTGYPYPAAAYMIDQMDNFHPLRKEEGTVSIDDRTRCIIAVVTVTDLVTGESRVGTDAHRITFKKGLPPSPESLVDMGNDAKSALSEAIRNAYSRFGISADVYKKVMSEPITDEQRTKLVQLFDSIPEVSQMWKIEQTLKFNKLHKEEANSFLEQLKVKIDERKANATNES